MSSFKERGEGNSGENINSLFFFTRPKKKEKKDKKEREWDNDSLPPGPDRVVSLSDTLSRRQGLCKHWPAGGLPSSHDSDVWGFGKGRQGGEVPRI